MVKAVVLGWMEELESWAKKPGRTRKTVSYWRKLVKEAGIDATKIGELTKDRKEWKTLTKERMRHLDKFERSRGNKLTGAEVPRNVTREEEVMCVCEECGKICKSKGGLTNHVRTMHKVSSLKKEFKCEKCGQIFKQEANLINHKKHARACREEEEEGAVGGAPAPARVHRRQTGPCPRCGKGMQKTNIARHLNEACKGR